MSTLSDQIDCLSINTRAIKATAARTATTTITQGNSLATVAGPYTRAVLSTQLGDLIRDIDPSELGLFTLQPPVRDVRAPAIGISRVEFSGATPLRKLHHRRDDVPKSKVIEPETYVEAALKCIDRYQTIRPMPRSHSQASSILERLVVVRENIQNLNEALQETRYVQGPSINSLFDDEGKHVQALQSRLSELKKRKEDVTSRQKLANSMNQSRAKHPPPAVPLPPSPKEDRFWDTPATAARTLRFIDNLMDEQGDLGDFTNTSFLPSSPSTRSRPDEVLSPEPLVLHQQNLERNLVNRKEVNVEGDDDDETVEEAEKTVVLKNMPVASLVSEAGSPSPTLHLNTIPVPGDPTPAVVKTPGANSQKVKINSEVERVVEKIWATMGDIIMPGHSYDISGRAAGNRPPRAKETIAHLRSLSALTPLPTSPSASSISSSLVGVPSPPTAQQILTAHLLLCLLTSSPHFSMPLNEAKSALVAKAGIGGSALVAGQSTIRILYGCVAKRLVKIERGGGEQIIKFDV